MLNAVPGIARRFEAVAFDLDGTLVDSALDFAAIRREIGCPSGLGLLEFIESLQDPDAEAEAHAVVHRFEMVGAASARWMPGARELLEILRERSVPVAILTRNSRHAVEETDRVLGLGVNLVVTREDGPPKPDPAGLLSIATTLNVTPDKMTYVGDFIDDLTAAKGAGMLAGLYRNAKNEHYADQADYVIHHFDELRLLWD